MSLFPRSYFSPETSFTPLFRLLDDFDSYSREQSSQSAKGSRRAVPSFSPRFDVKETETGYELHGELPGIEKENVTIEFTEPQTIVVSGRSERTYTSGAPPAGLLGEGGDKRAITDSTSHDHRASVSDEETEAAKEQGAEVVKASQQQQQQQQVPKERFWVSERSFGEFHRTFSFPAPVDQAAVTANLKDGVLSVTVPKAKKHESKRIAVL